MSRTALRAFAIWLLAMLAGVAIVYHSRFAADMSFFLPAKPTAEQQVLVDQIKEGVVSRLLMVGIGGGDSGQRARVSRALRQQLASDRQFVSVQNGETASLAAERDVLLKYRYLLSPAVEPARFTVDGLRSAIADSVDRLTSPAAMLLKPYLTSDPTGELYALLSRFDTGAQPESRDGVWASRDGERAMLLIQTRALGSDTDGQLAAIQTIERAFADAARSENLTGLSLQLSGPGRFAVEARATIQADVTRLSLISTLAIVAVLFAVYRSLRLMTLGLLPVLSGALAGIVAVSLVHGTVFGITVGFGSALIGEAVDYSIYYFVQSGRLGTAGWRERFWPTIRLGVLTSIFGFGALLFSGFPGLSQLGLYSLAGVFTAALVTRYLLPALAGDSHRLPDLSGFGQRLQLGIAQLTALRLPALLLSVAALGYLASERGELWHPNISLLSTVTAAEAEVDARLRADLAIGGGESGYIAIRPDDANIVYAGSYLGHITRYDHRTGQARNIQVWPETTIGAGAEEAKYRFQWTAPILLSPHDPDTLYITGNHVFRSRDEGVSWDILSPDLTRADPETLKSSGGPITKDNTGAEYYATIFAFAESPLQAGLFWAGSDDGLMHISRDGGKSWTEITPPDLKDQWALMSIIEASPHDPAVATWRRRATSWTISRPTSTRPPTTGRPGRRSSMASPAIASRGRSRRTPRSGGCSTAAPRPGSSSRPTMAQTGSRCRAICR